MQLTRCLAHHWKIAPNLSKARDIKASSYAGSVSVASPGPVSLVCLTRGSFLGKGVVWVWLKLGWETGGVKSAVRALLSLSICPATFLNRPVNIAES